MEPVRHRVGDVTLVRIPYVEITVPASTVGLDAGRVRAESEKWADPTWTDGDQVRVAAAVWIIESGGKRIVVDPTSTADDILRGDDAVAHQEAVASLLAEHGYPRESIDVTVATHVDGLGMLGWRTDDGWDRFFPNAPLLASAREVAFVFDESTFEPSGGAMFRALHERGAVTAVGDTHAITDDVSLRWTGAHAAGHQVVEIASRGERATFVGHLALSPVHCLIPEGQLHEDVDAAYAELRTFADGRLLFGPLWPTPGAIHWTADTVTAAEPGA
jgi:hypothetical protein